MSPRPNDANVGSDRVAAHPPPEAGERCSTACAVADDPLPPVVRAGSVDQQQPPAGDPAATGTGDSAADDGVAQQPPALLASAGASASTV